jgi:hypothetical protein
MTDAIEKVADCIAGNSPPNGETREECVLSFSESVSHLTNRQISRLVAVPRSLQRGATAQPELAQTKFTSKTDHVVSGIRSVIGNLVMCPKGTFQKPGEPQSEGPIAPADFPRCSVRNDGRL